VASFAHKPVMLTEVVGALRPKDGGCYADGTLGGAGHAEAILSMSSPAGWLYGCDRDGAALEAARERLARFAGRYEIRRGNFAELDQWVPARSCDGVLLDLGVSSPQLDQAERGFSFQQDGPLDMRMDQRQELTAAELVNFADERDLSRQFFEWGGESAARRIARAIVHDRQTRPFSTTAQLAGLIERICPRHGKRAHPATKVFQALRIWVNDEMGSLERGLESAWRLLRPGGRLAVITFHSVEDRVVKHWMRERARDYVVPGGVDVPELRVEREPQARLVARKAMVPGESELQENVRSRSAQLRVLERI
jgi:16S rRNA (cytosine1402-N4)-methyltransferase